MIKTMRAKMQVGDVTIRGDCLETIKMAAVTGTAAFGPNGESEDNTFARWTPAGSLELTITNPDLIGTFRPGQKFYLDFTPAPA